MARNPSPSEAAQIVLAASATEFPGATLEDTIGALYPLSHQRAIFAARVVQKAKEAGFSLQAAMVPTDDSVTLAAVSSSVAAGAVLSGDDPTPPL